MDAQAAAVVADTRLNLALEYLSVQLDEGRFPTT